MQISVLGKYLCEEYLLSVWRKKKNSDVWFIGWTYLNFQQQKLDVAKLYNH